jgi:hypothetical protein
MVFDSRNSAACDHQGGFDVRQVLRPRGPDPEDLLTREQTAAALTAAGYRVKEKTLATKASRGGGPPYHLFNGRAVYRWGSALAWARSSMDAPRSTRERPQPLTEGHQS